MWKRASSSQAVHPVVGSLGQCHRKVQRLTPFDAKPEESLNTLGLISSTPTNPRIVTIPDPDLIQGDCYPATRAQVQAGGNDLEIYLDIVLRKGPKIGDTIYILYIGNHQRREVGGGLGSRGFALRTRMRRH